MFGHDRRAIDRVGPGLGRSTSSRAVTVIYHCDASWLLMPPDPRRLKPGPGHDPNFVEADQRARPRRAIADLVYEVGYPKVTLTKVLRRAGVSKPTYYSLFESKEDCFLAAFAEVAGDLLCRQGVLGNEIGGRRHPVLGSDFDLGHPVVPRSARGHRDEIERASDRVVACEDEDRSRPFVWRLVPPDLSASH